ncbi:cyanophycin synthetase family protein [Caulobacter segnis]|uniref:cyanophycin synthetase family protein n=1 Tax=Caulobacter segnis TaxID=88688 RepID=UPI001CC13799|nr:hypothetical protein [Caulobacter segnis]UAL10099.1 hypothetical protein K8940_20390 [Caulobacter segnis]
MRVLETATYRGPHLYAARPMVRIQLDLGALEAWPTNRIVGFTDRLMVALPGLTAHGCSYKTHGGLVLRMREGTWLGHVIEHVALELQKLAGVEVGRGKTRSVKGRPGVYNILYVYEGEDLGRAAGRAAVELVNSLLPRDLAPLLPAEPFNHICGDFITRNGRNIGRGVEKSRQVLAPSAGRPGLEKLHRLDAPGYGLNDELLNCQPQIRGELNDLRVQSWR